MVFPAAHFSAISKFGTDEITSAEHIISQSILLIQLQDDIKKLRKVGIRDILSFKAIDKNSGIDNVVTAGKIDKEILNGIVKLLESEPMKTKVKSIARYIEETTNEEILKMTALPSVQP